MPIAPSMFAALAPLLLLLLLLSSPAEAADCVLQVPANPLSAQGLATPYQMTGCDMAGDTPSFVEAVIFDPATNQVSVYPPLVINAGTKPAVTPTPPNLPPGAVVGLWFGTNGDTLTLKGAGVAAGKCVNGLGNSIFGQFAYCNAPAFFQAAKGVTTPALGTGADGMPCLTTRDFGLVDMDPSDNVVTTYLLTKAKQVCQNTAANRAKNKGATVLVNGSDNALLNAVGAALNCARFTAPDLSDPGSMVNALALNELQASQQQQAPLALIQDNDPMTLVNNKPNQQKRNLYRQGVNQPVNVPETALTFCTNYRAIAPVRYLAGQQFTAKAASPDPAAGTNLFTFLCSRFEVSYGADGLNCVGLLKQASPFKVQKNGDIVTACALAANNNNNNNNNMKKNKAKNPPAAGKKKG